ncbi:MAG: CotH kinase family protein [Bacteroidales bacterium]|nr:CotH kinase family protein [Bacteroidales bacterium]MCF8391539.1 CotH kinase family protein [Bacteroidales bacterium]
MKLYHFLCSISEAHLIRFNITFIMFRISFRQFAFSLIIGISTSINIDAQQLFPEPGMLYDNTSVSRIDISILPDYLDIIINGDNSSDYEFPAIFTFTRDTFSFTIDSIGFRLRGNTSRNSEKKSFKVSLNSFVSGQKFFGVEKINLNGEHNDPSMARANIVWDILRKAGVPATRSSHTELYINGDYMGLYLNVEHIDEEFLKLRFGNNDGNLYKCTWPADLNYISNNQDDYKFSNSLGRTYELKRNEEIDDYSDLANFIYIINKVNPADFPEKLEPIFNINSFLKNYAVEVLTGHWDGYAYNKNNFYLYNNEETGRFEFIPYDTDNTFGRDWFGRDWAVRDIYNWSKGGEDRPLVENILDNDLYRDRYSFYMNRIIQEVFNSDSMNPNIYRIKNQIAPFAVNDMYRTKDYGFSYDDFTRSFDYAIRDHVKDGITHFISTRSLTALNQLETVNISPIVSRVEDNNPKINENISIRALIEDESNPVNAKLIYLINDIQKEISMSEIIGVRENYQANLNSVSTNTYIRYYIEASDEQFQTTRDPQFGYYELKIGDIFKNVEPNLTTNFKAYPNPFTNYIQLQVQENAYDARYILYDITGKELISGQIYEDMRIEFGNSVSEKGVYILKIYYSKGSGQRIEENLKLINLGI